MIDTARLKKLGTYTGYGIGDFGLNLYWTSLSLYLMFWYTNVLEISPRIAGALFFIGMVWDAITDPIVASLSERVKSRFGSYRPFILYGSGFLGISFITLFSYPPLTGVWFITIVVIYLLVFRTAYTIVAVPYAAMSARISFSSVERVELSGVRMFFAFGGMLLASNIFSTEQINTSAERGGIEAAISPFALLIAFIATLFLLICFFSTQERQLPPTTRHAKLVPTDLLKVFLTNGPLHKTLTAIALYSAGSTATMMALVFYIDAYQSQFAPREIVLTGFALCMMIGTPIWTLIVRALGRKLTWAMAAVLYAVSSFSIALTGPLIISGVPLQILLIGFANGAFAVMMWSLIPDTVEFGQLASGYRSEGIAYSSALVAQKVSGGATGLIFGFFLSEPVFDGSHVSVSYFLAYFPGTVILISLLPICLSRLNRTVHAEIVETISADEGG